MLTVELAYTGVMLTDHGAALWGIECNFPDGDNAYLQAVANDLLQEAIDKANELLEAIRKIIN